VITPRGLTFLATQEAKSSFSGFIATNKTKTKNAIQRLRREVTDMTHLNCIPPDQHDQDRDWALLRGMVITVIDEVKNSDASTDVNDSIEDVNDFLVTGLRHCCYEFSRTFKRRDR